jgi:hypothetical protein
MLESHDHDEVLVGSMEKSQNYLSYCSLPKTPSMSFYYLAFCLYKNIVIS